MSRSLPAAVRSRPVPARAVAAALILGLAAVSAPARAQNTESATDRKVQDRITAQKAQTDLRDRRCIMPQQPGADIVVCAKTDPEAERLPLRGELDSVRSTDDGLPRAPDVSGGGIFKGPPTVTGLCLVPPCPKEAVYYVDVAALPESPTGSDADLIGRGEKPQP